MALVQNGCHFCCFQRSIVGSIITGEYEWSWWINAHGHIFNLIVVLWFSVETLKRTCHDQIVSSMRKSVDHFSWGSVPFGGAHVNCVCVLWGCLARLLVVFQVCLCQWLAIQGQRCKRWLCTNCIITRMQGVASFFYVLVRHFWLNVSQSHTYEWHALAMVLNVTSSKF